MLVPSVSHQDAADGAGRITPRADSASVHPCNHAGGARAQVPRAEPAPTWLVIQRVATCWHRILSKAVSGDSPCGVCCSASRGDGPTCSLQGAAQTASAILRTDGIRGLYRGFGTVVFGTIPARGVRTRATR